MSTDALKPLKSRKFHKRRPPSSFPAQPLLDLHCSMKVHRLFQIFAMMRLIGGSAFLFMVTFRAIAAADDRPFAIENSRSPDGQIEIWMQPAGDEGMAAGIAQIRGVKSSAVSGTFAWSGFGVRAMPDAFKVLWRSDSRSIGS